MATIIVNSLADNTTADDGLITLREAILALNANNGAGNSDFAAITFDDTDDEIQFTGLTGTITLGGTELQITEELTLTGPGADDLTIDANMASRVINVTANVPLTVAGLTVTGGKTFNAAGIASDGDVTLIDSILLENNADSVVGGIFSDGDVTLIDSIVSNNTARSSSGGISSRGAVTLINSTVSNNTANGSGGGISSSAGGTIDNSTITNNTADADNDGTGDGGGIFNRSGTFTIRNSIVAGNMDGGG